MRGIGAEVVVINVEELLVIDEALKDEKLVDLTNEVLDDVVEEEIVVGLIEELFSEEIVEDAGTEDVEDERLKMVDNLVELETVEDAETKDVEDERLKMVDNPVKLEIVEDAETKDVEDETLGILDTSVELEINSMVEVATRLDEAADRGRDAILENSVKRRPSPQISALLPGQGIAQSVAGAGTLPSMRESPQ
jgi:hypothetical protein